MTPVLNTKVDAKIVNDSPFISIDCNFSGRVYSIDESVNYSDIDTLKQISNSCNSYLESILSNYLYKTCKEVNAGTNKLGKLIRKKFLTESDYQNYNWSSKYKDTFFDIDVDCSIKSSFLLTRT